MRNEGAEVRLGFGNRPGGPEFSGAGKRLIPKAQAARSGFPFFPA